MPAACRLGRLAALHVGLPRTHTFEGRPWRSAIAKCSVATRLWLSEVNLAGDRQANTRFHGGPDKAVCCFALEHYPFWRAELAFGEALAPGAFGENFTLQGLLEEEVCIGDAFQVGSAVVQVSQPRQPCINLARRWDRPRMPARMVEVGHTGFYLRVLQPGEVGAGDAMLLSGRCRPDISVAFANDAMHQRAGGADRAALLADLPELSDDWRSVFRRRCSELPA